jgi:hypothetical protein
MAVAAAATPDAFDAPEELVANVADLLSCTPDVAQTFLHASVLSIAETYDSRRYKVYWSQVDAQALALMLADDRWTAFAKEHGELAMKHLEENQAFTSRLSDVQRAAFDNLGLWLRYAVQPYKKFRDWEKATETYHMTAALDGLRYMCKPLLKLTLPRVEAVATILRTPRGDATNDARRILVRDALFEDCHEEVDYCLTDIVADALVYADSKLTPDKLAKRLYLQYDRLKGIILTRQEADAAATAEAVPSS